MRGAGSLPAGDASMREGLDVHFTFTLIRRVDLIFVS